jgi:hypothetical protein
MEPQIGQHWRSFFLLSDNSIEEAIQKCIVFSDFFIEASLSGKRNEKKHVQSRDRNEERCPQNPEFAVRKMLAHFTRSRLFEGVDELVAH